MKTHLLAFLAVTTLAGCAHRRSGDVTGPATSRLDLYKPWPGADKLYVEVDLGDGEPRMMLLDSGAGTSLVSPEVAAALNLRQSTEVSQYLQVSGVLEARSAVIPELRIGRQRIRNVHVAVPLEPVHDQAGAVPTAGLLGANVLSQFQVVVDYPANRLELHRAHKRPPPPGGAPLFFDGQHAMTGVVLVARQGQETVEEKLLVDIDTGARGLWLFGELSPELAAMASEGLEPVVGVSSGEGQPLRSFLQTTRRIPVVQVHVGGTVVERELEATWTSFPGGEELALSSPGLLGHSVLDGHRAVLDYQAQRFALLPPDQERPENDIHAWGLRALRKGHAPDKGVRLAELYAWMGDLDAARQSLERHHRRQPDDPTGTVLLARMTRMEGQAEQALGLLEVVPVADLVELGEVVAVVNGLWLEGRAPQALELATLATQARPEHPLAWIALSDARRAAGDLSGARAALSQANTLAEEPDGQLLRRAWIAAAEGDDLAGLTHLRRQLDLEPSGFITPWFYGILAQKSLQTDLLRGDLDRLRAQLHPGQGALDFLAAAYHRAGQQDLAVELSVTGRERDCGLLEDAPRRQNCEAWYRGIVGEDLGEARRLVELALVDSPDSSEFLDTLAVVLEAQGDRSGAADASRRAARLAPDDVYLLWQAARLEQAARDTGS